MRIICATALGWLVCAACSEGAQSEWVYAAPDGKLVYKTTPAGDRIMDFSSAGYLGGGAALPTVPVMPQSLYLAQLAERLGPQAVKNIGY